MSRVRAGLVALALSACGGPRQRAEGRQATLAAGVAAVVGPDSIEATLVNAVAKEGAIPEERARDALVADALYAAGARERFGTFATHHAEVVARSRALLEALRVESSAKGPPTDAELAEVTLEHWWELDRPVMRRTTHAVALAKKPEDEAAARALAERVAAAVANVHDGAAFRALAIPLGNGTNLRVEDLDPVAADGRVVNLQSPPTPGTQGRSYTPAFAVAAFSIPGVGDKTGIVRTEFGFHVILLTEIIPELRVPAAARLEKLSPEIMSHRFEDLARAAIDRAKSVHRVEVERSAEELMEKVHVDR